MTSDEKIKLINQMLDVGMGGIYEESDWGIVCDMIKVVVEFGEDEASE